MTENERRILTLLSKHGPLSKRELAAQGPMGWATVVKMVERLEQAGMLECVGTDARPETSGKNPLLYDLVERNPLALGIDVSYSTTTVILSNLKNVVLEQQAYPTPPHLRPPRLCEFLAETFTRFIKERAVPRECLNGVGIGVPLWTTRCDDGTFAYPDASLAEKLQTAVRIENNVRSYVMYKKWVGKAFALDDFILITIRSGVGTGIFYRGELIRGVHGMAGELSHLPVVEDGRPCRCGKHGCLETLVNQDGLYRDYVKDVLHNGQLLTAPVSETERSQGLALLFSLAKQQHGDAAAIVRRAAHYLGVGIATLLLLFDIPDIIIAADFGPDGDALIPEITREIDQRIIIGFDYRVRYYPLERLGFAQGAALLILNDYLVKL